MNERKVVPAAAVASPNTTVLQQAVATHGAAVKGGEVSDIVIRIIQCGQELSSLGARFLFQTRRKESSSSDFVTWLG